MKDNRKLITPAVLSLLLVLALVWGYNQNSTKMGYETALENHYQRLFFDVKKHVENIQVNLSKVLVSSSKEQNIVLLSQIMTESYSAKDKLGQMPMAHAETAKTEKFLTQSGDFSSYLIQRQLAGSEITEENVQSLKELQTNSASFNSELAKLHDNMMESNFILGSTTNRQNKKIQQANSEVLQTSLVTMDKQVGKTPELIYDGPFSDQILNKKAVGLSAEAEKSPEEAKDKITKFLSHMKISNIEMFEEGEHINDTKIPAYTFQVSTSTNKKDSPIYVAVAKRGARVIWLTNTRAVSNIKLTIDQAKEKAREFLKSKGLENMEPNYYLEYNGSVLFNFIYTENDITMYPDLIKVKVALDNGDIVGFDASAYYMNHMKRDIETPTLTEEEARQKVKIDFNIDSIRLGLIPKGKNEILCYEFKGKYNDSDFIIYINSKTGAEEQILQIIKDEKGTLTF